MGNIFLFACASVASAAVAYGFNQIGFSFATASIPKAILASGIGIVLAGATALTARDVVRDCRRGGRDDPDNIQRPIGGRGEQIPIALPVVPLVDQAGVPFGIPVRGPDEGAVVAPQAAAILQEGHPEERAAGLRERHPGRDR